MPKFPVLVAPAPNEPIASQAWGVPVTNAINGLYNGRGIVGCLLVNEAASQGIDNTIETIAFNATDVYWDSDAMFDDATDSVVIRPGLAGLWEVLFTVTAGTFPNDASFRILLQKNGATLGQWNNKIGYNSSALATIHGFWRLADNDVIVVRASSSTAVTISRKMWRMSRIGD